MLNKKIEEALNEQINAEMWSAYLYLSMAAYCHSIGQPGMASWFEVQFQEEQDHAKILFNYINSRNGRVELKAIDAVPTEWDGILDVFESTLKHEQKVTSQRKACSNGLSTSRWKRKRTPRLSSTTSR